jgi:carboxypeptidase C (cathepsin A)
MKVKRKARVITLYLSMLCFIATGILVGGTTAAAKEKTPGKKPIMKLVKKGPAEKISVSKHTVVIDKKTLHYTATTGYMKMEDESGKHQASMYYVAYTLDGTPNTAKRPLTFAFNGGPGSASLWLHMGALGPRRVAMTEEGFQLPQPYRYEDNEYSWLPFTDLVFIDPVSTGYSRPAPGVEKKNFHGLNEDIRSVAEFIRLYVTRNKRWISPKYLCGESYGTTRAAGLSGYLQDEFGMNLKGVVLISAVMNFQTVRFTPGNDLPYVLFLPTYTAGAWYHKKLPPKYQEDLKTTLDEVEKWALTDYLVALAKGSRLTKEERKKIIDRLADYTGLSRDYIDKYDLRIAIYDFTQQLLSDEKQKVGRLDNRFARPTFGMSENAFESDPSYLAIYGPYTAAFNEYVRKELKYTNDIFYHPITNQITAWNWGLGVWGQGYVNVAEILRKAIIKNPNLKVLVANGYHDLATPYFATEYTVNHMQLPPNLAKNIRMKYYMAGHMMYIKDSCLKRLYRDAADFYAEASAGR